MMLNVNDPEFFACYPFGAIVRDRWGRQIPGVIACDLETGEVISYDGTWLTGEWLRLTRRIRIAVVTRHIFRWASPSGGLLQRHGFWPAPLTVKECETRHINCRCSHTIVGNSYRETLADFGTVRERIVNATDGPALTLAQLDNMIMAMETQP